jgi:hypothetical protein
MKRALIDPRTKRVCMVVDAGAEFPVAPPLVWVNADDTVKVEYKHDAGVFTPRPRPPEPAPTEHEGFESRVMDAIDALIKRGQLSPLVKPTR